MPVSIRCSMSATETDGSVLVSELARIRIALVAELISHTTGLATRDSRIMHRGGEPGELLGAMQRQPLGHQFPQHQGGHCDCQPHDDQRDSVRRCRR